jgi:dipeptidase D
MKYVTEGYEPRDVLRFFEDISRIPRGSNNEYEVGHYVYNWGKDLGLDAYIDEANNVILKKPGSKGCEDLPPVVLQGHLDIVAEKLPESTHDFLKDPLPLYVEDGILRSRGTTLGADNGNAIAYMMGVLSRNDLVHPPLECIFTTGEEIGLVGANKLDRSKFDGMRMINMDGGGMDQTVFTVSAAGGNETRMYQPAQWQDAKGEFISIELSGMLGGHSAGYNSLTRGNAVKILARMLYHVSDYTKFTIAKMDGGSKMNAIPSSITAVIGVDDRATALAELNKIATAVKEELRVKDPGFVCNIAVCDAPEKTLTELQSKRLVQFLLALPHGIRDMNPEIEGAILNSNNLAAVHVYDDRLFVWCMNRANDDTRQDRMDEEIRAVADAFGFSVEIGSHFYGWKYEPESKMRRLHKKLFKKVFDIDLKEESAHGGLETGVFYSKKPGMDIITMGPKSDGAHTPNEMLVLESFKEMFDYLCLFLEELTKE